jgi:hypothetical protein
VEETISLSIRISLVLVILLALSSILGTWLYLEVYNSEDDNNQESPYLYRISNKDMTAINIKTNTNEISVEKREDQQGLWFFTSLINTPLNLNRWGGFTFLLQGPLTSRFIDDSEQNRSKFGLDEPTLSLQIELSDGSKVEVELGDKTPDGSYHYATVKGRTKIMAVDVSWGEVIQKLADIPPLPDWFYSLDPMTVTEIVFYIDGKISKAFGYIKSNPENSFNWEKCELLIHPETKEPYLEIEPCRGKQIKDQKELRDLIKHISKPDFDGIASEGTGLKTPKDFEKFGANSNSPHIFIRTEGFNSKGNKIISRVAITFGSNSPDGKHVFVVPQDGEDVILADKKWAQEILNNFN